MTNNRIIQILRVFNKKEVRAFRKWVASPAHNQREDVILLYDFLFEKERFHSDLEITKKNIFKAVYQSNNYDDAKMRQLVFFAIKPLESFLAYTEYLANPTRQKIDLATAYQKRKQFKLLKKTLQSIQKENEKAPHQNSDFLYNRFLFEKINYANIQLLKDTQSNAHKISNAHNISFISEKLKQSCLILTHLKIYTGDYEIGLLDAIINYIEEKKLLNIPAIAVYYHIYKTITESQNETHFENLKQEIEKHGLFFPVEEIRMIFLLSLNYCIRRMNAGDEKYIRESFELYKKGFESNVLIENNYISDVSFQNVVSIAIKLKEYNWATLFVNGYQQYLNEKDREGIVYFCLTRLHFEKGELEEAMVLNQKIETDNLLIDLNAKTILLKILYIKDEHAVLESLLESMRNYLVRKKVIGYHKANYKHIIKFTKKLVRVNPYSTVEKEKLRKAIEATSPLTERDWLLQELDKL